MRSSPTARPGVSSKLVSVAYFCLLCCWRWVVASGTGKVSHSGCHIGEKSGELGKMPGKLLIGWGISRRCLLSFFYCDHVKQGLKGWNLDSPGGRGAKGIKKSIQCSGSVSSGPAPLRNDFPNRFPRTAVLGPTKCTMSPLGTLSWICSVFEMMMIQTWCQNK